MRPNRQVRRRYGNTDVVDAIAAARPVLSGDARHAQDPRRRSRGPAGSESVAAQRHQGPYPGDQPAAFTAGHRPGPAAGQDAGPDPTQRDLLATCEGFRVASDDSLAATARPALRELAQRALFLRSILRQPHSPHTAGIHVLRQGQPPISTVDPGCITRVDKHHVSGHDHRVPPFGAAPTQTRPEASPQANLQRDAASTTGAPSQLTS